MVCDPTRYKRRCPVGTTVTTGVGEKLARPRQSTHPAGRIRSILPPKRARMFRPAAA